MPNTTVIGIDLGGTKLAGALFTRNGKIVRKSVVPLEGRQGRAVGELICQELKALLATARAKQVRVSAIGVSVPGISYSRTGRVWAPNIPGWEDYPLRREIQAALPDKRIQVVIDSDRAAYILGETWRGVAKGCRPFRCEYVGCGCFEYHASGAGLAKVANELLAPSPGSSPNEPSLQHSFDSARDVFAAYDRNDPLAKQVIAQAVEFWGMTVANLVSLFNPEKIIFGGGVFGPAAQFLGDIYAEARKWAQPISIKQVKLQASKLGGDAGFYGAGCLALQAAGGADFVTGPAIPLGSRQTRVT